jgi:hypothetical protein
MSDLQILPDILKLLIPRLEHFLNTKFNDRSKTLPLKIRQTKNNIIITWNVFPDPSHDLTDLFTNIKTIISNQLDNLTDGEILYHEISKGSIFDSGSEVFLIKNGFSWDIYLYKPETFIYARLLHESQIDKQQEEWISIDIDVVNNSAWFKD